MIYPLQGGFVVDDHRGDLPVRYIVLAAIIFAETGLLVGFFLPGDSLLVTAGLLASTDAFGDPSSSSLVTPLVTR